MPVITATFDGTQPELRLRGEGVMREGGKELYLSEAFRTRQQQQWFWDRKVGELMARGYSRAAAEREARKWVAPPGHSDHEKGNALDIGIFRNAGYDLRARLCKRWGLKANVVGEAWHYVLDPLRGPVPTEYPLLPATALPTPPPEDVMTPQTIVDSCPTPSKGGTWRLQYDGGIQTNGDAMFYGSYWSLPPEARQGNRGGFVAIAPNWVKRGDLWVLEDGYVIQSADGAFYNFNPDVARDLQARKLL